jgi:hypothetical protein
MITDTTIPEVLRETPRWFERGLAFAATIPHAQLIEATQRAVVAAVNMLLDEDSPADLAFVARVQADAAMFEAQRAAQLTTPAGRAALAHEAMERGLRVYVGRVQDDMLSAMFPEWEQLSNMSASGDMDWFTLLNQEAFDMVEGMLTPEESALVALAGKTEGDAELTRLLDRRTALRAGVTAAMVALPPAMQAPPVVGIDLASAPAGGRA